MKTLGPDWMPVWAQRLQWLFYACFALWLALLILSDPFEHPYLSLGLCALMMFPAAVRAYFMMHAVGRGEINAWTAQKTRRTDE